MQKFKIGDIVSLPNNDDVLFVITDCADFEYKNITEYEYEIVQIFPVTKAMKFMNMSERNILLHADRDSMEANMVVEFIKKERIMRGWTDEPEFIQIVRDNIRYETGDDLVMTVVSPNPKSTTNHKIKDGHDIHYESFKTIDECLDAINNLKALYKLFGDEVYLEKLEVVKKRLKKLI